MINKLKLNYPQKKELKNIITQLDTKHGKTWQVTPIAQFWFKLEMYQQKKAQARKTEFDPIADADNVLIFETKK